MRLAKTFGYALSFHGIAEQHLANNWQQLGSAQFQRQETAFFSKRKSRKPSHFCSWSALASQSARCRQETSEQPPTPSGLGTEAWTETYMHVAAVRQEVVAEPIQKLFTKLINSTVKNVLQNIFGSMKLQFASAICGFLACPRGYFLPQKNEGSEPHMLQGSLASPCIS